MEEGGRKDLRDQKRWGGVKCCKEQFCLINCVLCRDRSARDERQQALQPVLGISKGSGE